MENWFQRQHTSPALRALNLILSLSLLCLVSGYVLPNIVVILSDDQDVELHGMFPLQETMDLIGRAGAQFNNAYTSTPLCCPARASILTGQYAHNHRTTNNSISGGCNGQLWKTRSEPRALPVLLAERGYRTFYAGKYLNEFRGEHVPPGWTEFHGLHGNSRYYNYTLLQNGRNVSYTDTYLTDLISDLAVDFIQQEVQWKRMNPFFVMLAPPAAHAPYTPAPRHEGTFAKWKALRTPSFNVPTKDKHWLVGSSKVLPNETIATIDKYFQKRWESLLAVDEMVSTLVALLNETQLLDNTYIVYTSDNGYHLGQFSQPFDKRQPYETDIRVPLLVRGPGIAKGSDIQSVVSLIDLAPTILTWANALIPSYMDGQSFNENLLKPLPSGINETYKRHLLIEYWGEGNYKTYNPECPGSPKDRLAQCTTDADCHCQDAWNNTYACVRDFQYKVDRIYCEFRDTENTLEAYDLKEDPYQMKNIAYDLLPIERALYGIMLQNLTKCSGHSCNL
ncbi:uncharacterized protein Dwil_GK10744 [Drosophila willistoni]|uniref:Sulfatase N-terminal domain-containing protein n=1 Tax=Drosophila willistoni TaxID=7260 RepID=B4MIX0_DROWI|nr:uncharacterized protein Dwil_GK10744 [Drosophila willistoni]